MRAADAAGVAATVAYQRTVGTLTTGFVTALDQLQAALGAQDLAGAQAAELTAQGHYDGIRFMIGTTPATAPGLDGLAADVPHGGHLAGLHLVEEDLWPAGGPADAADLAAAGAAVARILASAPLLKYSLPLHRITPQVITTHAEQTLEWVDQYAVTGREEAYSHLDAVDAAASVAAAQGAFADVAPLGLLVAPSATATVSAAFGVLAQRVAALGSPGTAVDQAIAPAAWTALAQQVDVVADDLGRLAPAFDGYGPRQLLRVRVVTGPAGAPGPARGGRPGGAISRRQLLAGTGAVGTGLVGASLGASPADAAPAGTGPSSGAGTVPFHGAHQAGIVTPQPAHLVFAVYDVTTGRSGLGALLAGWTAAAARLTAGQALTTAEVPAVVPKVPPPKTPAATSPPATLDTSAAQAPPPDTGEATGLPAANLTLTVGFGPGLFDGRFGLAGRRPAALAELPAMPGDALDPARSGGDLCIQACADDAQVAFHAVHNLTRLASGSATLRYYQVGFTAPPGPGPGAGPVAGRAVHRRRATWPGSTTGRPTARC